MREWKEEREAKVEEVEAKKEEEKEYRRGR